MIMSKRRPLPPIHAYLQPHFQCKSWQRHPKCHYTTTIFITSLNIKEKLSAYRWRAIDADLRMSVTVVEAGNTLTAVTGISYKEWQAFFTLRTLKPNNNFLMSLPQCKIQCFNIQQHPLKFKQEMVQYKIYRDNNLCTLNTLHSNFIKIQ